MISRSEFLPESNRAFDMALRMRERAAQMSGQARDMFLAALEAIAASIETRMLRSTPLSSHPTGSYRLSRADYDAMLFHMLDKAIALTGADMGNIQLFDPGLQALKIEAQRGFDRRFLEFFAAVHPGQAACGRAIRDLRPVVVEDVTRSPIFRDSPSLEVLIDAKVRAVQSIPLISRSGAVLGVFSTRFCRPCLLNYRTFRLMEFFKHGIAGFIEACVPLQSNLQVNSGTREGRLRGIDSTPD